MMVMTAKVDFKKVIAVLAGIAGVIIALVLIFGGGDSTPTAAPSVAGNEGRVQFLKNLGWEVTASPTESGQVRIPKEQNAIFARYNELQKSADYDLEPHAGRTVMRYVYKVTNFPGATEPVYATLLVHNDKVIGGDITNTAANGTMQALVKRSQDALPDVSLPQPTGTDRTQPIE